MELIELIKECKTISELDKLRIEIINASKGNPDIFKQLQNEFIKKKNQLNRTSIEWEL